MYILESRCSQPFLFEFYYLLVVRVGCVRCELEIYLPYGYILYLIVSELFLVGSNFASSTKLGSSILSRLV